MSIKVHFLHRHLDKFLDNRGGVSDKQGEQFHQDIKTMEEHYKRQWNKLMMADYCLSIKIDTQERENLYHSSYVHEGYIPAVSLFNHLMKILVSHGIFKHVIFKDLGSDLQK